MFLNLLLQSKGIKNGWILDKENIDIGTIDNNVIQIKINVNRLETADLDGLNKYLDNNNIIFYYESATPELIDLGQIPELPKHI